MKKTTKPSDAITTFFGAGASLEGVIKFDGTIRIDGKISGKISSTDGTVIVGEKAVVEGDIIVAVAVIMGRVKGVIHASDRIEVYPPASIDGDIQAPVISIDAGVAFNGMCAMHSGRVATDPKAAFSNDDPADETKVKKISKNF